MQSKIDYSLYLKYFIFPTFSFISIVVIYVLLILPYLNTKSELDSTRESKNTSIKNYETKLTILKDARLNRASLNSYQSKLIQLVPDEDSPAPLVASLDSTALEYKFNKIDDNKNIAEKSLSDMGLIESRFNGRTVGALSALNFLSAINSNKNRLINIRDLELFDDRDNKYYRVSFIARTIFNKTKSNASLELPVQNIIKEEKFINFMNFYIK